MAHSVNSLSFGGTVSLESKTKLARVRPQEWALVRGIDDARRELAALWIETPGRASA